MVQGRACRNRQQPARRGLTWQTRTAQPPRKSALLVLMRITNPGTTALQNASRSRTKSGSAATGFTWPISAAKWHRISARVVQLARTKLAQTLPLAAQCTMTGHACADRDSTLLSPQANWTLATPTTTLMATTTAAATLTTMMQLPAKTTIIATAAGRASVARTRPGPMQQLAALHSLRLHVSLTSW